MRAGLHAGVRSRFARVPSGDPIDVLIKKEDSDMTDELMSEIKVPRTTGSIIMVVGVGGAGGNAVNHMWNLGIRGVTFMVCNTDQQALDKSPVEQKIRLGSEGLGAGNDPENGRRAAVETLPEIRQALEEAGRWAC